MEKIDSRINTPKDLLQEKVVCKQPTAFWILLVRNVDLAIGLIHSL